MEQRSVEKRRVEIAVNEQIAAAELQGRQDIESHARHHGNFYFGRDYTAQHLSQHIHAVFSEGHRCVGFQPLVEAEYTRGPLPAAVAFAFHHNLFAQGMDALLLFQRINIFCSEVLVDEHAVFQELITRYGAQSEALRLVFEVQPCIQQIAVVTAFAVVGDCTDIGFHVFALGGGIDAACIIVRIAALVAVFVAYVQVRFPVLGRQVDAAEASSGRLSFIYFLIVQRRVAEEAAFVVIEAAGGESETLGHPVVMRQRSVVGIVRARAHAKVCALIGERRFGVNLNQPAHRVASVQGSLRAAQYVDAFDVGVVEVESGFVDVGDVVHIQSDGRRVDARADASDVNGGSQA